MPNLAKLVSQKLKAEGLTVTAAAKSAGISLPSFRGVVSGKSVPNARSVDKYASFLGISVDQLVSAAGKATRGSKGKAKAKKAGKAMKGAKKAKRGRPAKAKTKAPKIPGRRGRPPTPGPSPRVIKRLVAQLARAEKALGKAKAILA
ncbi:MAG: helix-turn-helix transcriptional regulator [Planctomycetes bacterium]|nr:helix-turn-helix transcriptional regulator [Planctomycetota bacterium]